MSEGNEGFKCLEEYKVERVGEMFDSVFIFEILGRRAFDKIYEMVKEELMYLLEKDYGISRDVLMRDTIRFKLLSQYAKYFTSRTLDLLDELDEWFTVVDRNLGLKPEDIYRAIFDENCSVIKDNYEDILLQVAYVLMTEYAFDENDMKEVVREIEKLARYDEES